MLLLLLFCQCSLFTFFVCFCVLVRFGFGLQVQPKIDTVFCFDSLCKKSIKDPTPELIRILSGTWDGQSNFLSVCLHIIFPNQLTYCKGVFEISSTESLLYPSPEIVQSTCCQSLSHESFHHSRRIPPLELSHRFSATPPSPLFLAGGGLHDSWTDYSSSLLEL